MVNVYLIVDQIQNYSELPPKTDIFSIALIYTICLREVFLHISYSIVYRYYLSNKYVQTYVVEYTIKNLLAQSLKPF